MFRIACMFGLAGLLTVGGTERARGDQPPVERPACANVRPDVRAGGVGFDHIVYVENRCKVTLVCQVSTDINPYPAHRLVVAPSEEKGVVTGKNAPHRKFEPRVTCVRRTRPPRRTTA